MAYRDMDDSTYSHFTAWADNNLREDERVRVGDAMYWTYCTGDDEDRERYESHGWPHLYALVVEQGAPSPLLPSVETHRAEP